MPSKNAAEWSQNPPLKTGEWVDSRIYSDQSIFNEEIAEIWKKVWLPLCHESELPEVYDFRTFTIAGEPLIVVRGPDRRVRAFLNVCPHRGMLIERRPSGSFKPAQPSGSPKHMTCMFHGWQWDMKGNCKYVSREKEGYQDRFSRKDAGLREFKCEVYFGGFVWVTLDDAMEMTVADWGAGAFDCIQKCVDEEPLEVFHYHRAIIGSNYKLWHDTNSEFYHDYMHYHNRVTGFNDAYFARKNYAFPNGHVNVGTFEVQYDHYAGFESRETLSFPHLPPNNWYMIDMFPGVNFNLRGSALRCDFMTPLGPDKVLIEFRGLGLASDSAEQRRIRVDHHNTIWGPFGRNLHEYLIGIAGQCVTMSPAGEQRRVLHGRHENHFIHDEVGMRHFYDEWGKRMNRLPSDPGKPYVCPGEKVEAAA